jgi:hypothetical protein
MLILWVVRTSALNMKAVFSSETLVSKRRHDPEEQNQHLHRPQRTSDLIFSWTFVFVLWSTSLRLKRPPYGLKTNNAISYCGSLTSSIRHCMSIVTYYLSLFVVYLTALFQ